jgi:hypothetical protein
MSWAMGDSVFDSQQRSDFYVSHSSHTGPETHQASYPIGKCRGEGLPPGIKRPLFETYHLSPSSAGVNMGGAIHPFPQTSSWSSV